MTCHQCFKEFDFKGIGWSSRCEPCINQNTQYKELLKAINGRSSRYSDTKRLDWILDSGSKIFKTREAIDLAMKGKP